MNELEEILIIGTRSALSESFARLAVAYGLEPIWVSEGAPADFEPWHHAIRWNANPSNLTLKSNSPLIAVVFDDAEASDFKADRWVFVRTPPFAGMLRAITEESELGTVEIHTGLLHENDPLQTEVESSEQAPEATNHVAIAAMATLRCALEYERKGVISPHEVSIIGDAMMLQSTGAST